MMILGLPILATSGANGQNVEDVLLQLNHQSYLLKKSKGARKSGSGVRKRIVPVIISQAREADVTATAKMTRGTNDSAVLLVRHNGSERRARAWNRLPHALQKNLMMTNGLKNPPLVFSWDPLPFR